jgi:hypothetical protein
MHCRKARLALVERDLGTLSREAQGRLEQHLGGCATCDNEARIDAQWIAELALLRQDYPQPVDVGGVVMSRVRQSERIVRTELRGRQLAWATSIVVACGLLVVVGVWSTLPEPAQVVEGGSTLLSVTARAFDLAAGPLATVLVVAVRLIGSLLSALAAVGSSLERLLPAAWVATGLACLGMAAMITAIVGRDLLAPTAVYVRKER